MANSDLHCPSESYTFDSLGRLTNRVISGTTYLYTYGSAAHVDAPTAYHGNSYSYDAVGSQLTGTVSGVAETRSFDPEDRLAGVVTTGGTHTTSFVYDGNGKRVLQTVSIAGTTTSTLYVGNLYEEQLTGTNHPSISYYFLGGKLVGLRRANQANSATNGQYRLVGDHLGSVSVLVDTASPPAVVERLCYKPYGEMAYQYTAVSSLTSVNYTGQRLDSESGLLYYGARYYDAALGYFVSADRADAQPAKSLSEDWDRYIYARGNPLRYIDPSGYGPHDYYVFVNGCEDLPIVGNNCGNGASDWTEYYKYLNDLYNSGGWGYAVNSQGRYVSFNEWASTHVISVHVSDPINGWSALANRLSDIPSDYGRIHIIGHSHGAAAIWQYLDEAWMTEQLFASCPSCNRSGPVLNNRIADVTLISAPLDFFAGEPSLGTWVSSKGIRVVNVDTANDPVSSHPIPGIYRNYQNADYTHDANGQVRSDLPTTGLFSDVPNDPASRTAEGFAESSSAGAWHSYTFTHMAVETQNFLDSAWR